MSLRVEVSLMGPLSRYFQGERTREVQLPEGAAVADILHRLSLARGKTSLITVNGVKAPLTRLLNEGDKVVVFPPVSGG
jgi:molybdopterin converting factor small subunit